MAMNTLLLGKHTIGTDICGCNRTVSGLSGHDQRNLSEGLEGRGYHIAVYKF